MLHFQDAKDFAICNWYNSFKDVTLKTILIELPETLVAKFAAEDLVVDPEEDYSEEFAISVKNALNELNNNAFVKSNWHAPLDSKIFSAGKELKVTNIDDLMLYLVASNNTSKDCSISQVGIPVCIALKPWLSIHPATEFRCIVINNVLRGITPRDWPTYHTYFIDEGPLIIEAITNFFEENVVTKFSRIHYTFDVIISFPDPPILLDFGPLKKGEELYAFSWKEIAQLINKETLEGVAPVFRYLEKSAGIVKKKTPEAFKYVVS